MYEKCRFCSGELMYSLMEWRACALPTEVASRRVACVCGLDDGFRKPPCPLSFSIPAETWEVGCRLAPFIAGLRAAVTWPRSQSLLGSQHQRPGLSFSNFLPRKRHKMLLGSKCQKHRTESYSSPAQGGGKEAGDLPQETFQLGLARGSCVPPFHGTGKPKTLTVSSCHSRLRWGHLWGYRLLD